MGLKQWWKNLFKVPVKSLPWYLRTLRITYCHITWLPDWDGPVRRWFRKQRKQCVICGKDARDSRAPNYCGAPICEDCAWDMAPEVMGEVMCKLYCPQYSNCVSIKGLEHCSLADEYFPSEARE